MEETQIKESELETARGKVIGVGRVKIPKMYGFNYEIPLLSFVVIEKEDGSFVSSCIHLQIDGYGKINDKKPDEKADEKAIINMISNVYYFLYENFNNEKCKDNCWTNLYDLSKSNSRSNILWDKYHAFIYMLAEKGITMDKYSHFNKKIEDLQDKVKELEETIKEMNNQERDKLISRFITSESSNMIIKYKKMDEQMEAA